MVELPVQQDHTAVEVAVLQLEGLLELVQAHQAEQEQQLVFQVHQQLMVVEVEVPSCSLPPSSVRASSSCS